MEKLHAKFASAPKASSRCFRRFMDVELLKHDLADDKSLITRKLTPEEAQGVLFERSSLAIRCVAGAKSDTPFLYQRS